jgi:hypothetical protein
VKSALGARDGDRVDEIVRAVNPKHDSVSSLATYFCQFAQHFLKATAVRCHPRPGTFPARR